MNTALIIIALVALMAIVSIEGYILHNVCKSINEMETTTIGSLKARMQKTEDMVFTFIASYSKIKKQQTKKTSSTEAK